MKGVGSFSPSATAASRGGCSASSGGATGGCWAEASTANPEPRAPRSSSSCGSALTRFGSGSSTFDTASAPPPPTPALWTPFRASPSTLGFNGEVVACVIGSTLSALRFLELAAAAAAAAARAGVVSLEVRTEVREAVAAFERDSAVSA